MDARCRPMSVGGESGFVSFLLCWLRRVFFFFISLVSFVSSFQFEMVSVLVFLVPFFLVKTPTLAHDECIFPWVMISKI